MSSKVSVYGEVTTGKNCRIDDFCILTGNIVLHNHIHIGAYSFLAGQQGIEMHDFSGMSSRISMFTAGDDHASGLSLLGPCIPEEFRPTLSKGPIVIERHAHIGAHSIVLPGVRIGEGTCVGALSLVKEDLEPWSLYAGIPAKKIRDRPKEEILRLEEMFLNKLAKGEL